MKNNPNTVSLLIAESIIDQDVINGVFKYFYDKRIT